MNLTIKVTLDGKNFLAMERTIAAIVSPSALRQLAMASADRVADAMRDHFLAKDTRGNKRGWPRSNFWQEMARATTRGTGEGAEADVIVGDRRLAIHVYGGEVRRREKRALTIPLHAMAKGKRVRQLESELGTDIFRLKSRRGRTLPADSRGVLAAKINGRIVKLYALRTRVKIPRDPEALPSAESLRPALEETFHDWMEITTGGVA